MPTKSNDNLTDTLKAVIPHINAVVSASAGTGKTWLLIARLLRLLLAGATPDSILAITFTEKAAAEIVERLHTRLRHWASTDESCLRAELQEIGIAEPKADDIHTARLLYEQLLNAPEPIQITTFHAFCGELLKRFPFEAGVPFGFEILSETWELRQAAFSQLFAAAAEPQHKELYTALHSLSTHCQGLYNTVIALENFLDHQNDWRSFTEHLDDPAAFAAEQLRQVMDIDPNADITLPKKVHQLLTEYENMLRSYTSPRNDFSKWLLNIQTIQQNTLVDEAILTDLKTIFFTQANKRRKLNKISQSKLNNYSLEEFSNTFECLADYVEEIEKQFLARQSWQRNAAWYTVGHQLSTIYDRLKNRRQALDFSDLEWFACRLINAQDAAVQYYLNQRIRHILIDEFQDTNPNQWQLIVPLLEEMAAQKSDNSIFIVGDIKQSIYGFRRANPQLQTDVTEWLQEHMDGIEYSLDLSRRSSPEIIQLINQVFNESEYQGKLHDFRLHATAVTIPGAAEILPFCTKPKTKDDKDPPWRSVLRDRPAEQVANPCHQEAQMVAAKINELVRRQTPVHITNEISDTRPLRYGDMMILLRTRRNIAYFEQAFSHAGIPFIRNINNFLETLEVSDILSLLRFLLTPNDNLSLAQVLRSPLFSASEEQLITLAESNETIWFQAIQALEKTDYLWEYSLARLNRWRSLCDRIPVHDLLDTIYADSNAIQRYRLSVPAEDADLIENNLATLLDYSLDFESGRYPGIRHFLRHIEDRSAYYSAHGSRGTATTKTTAADPEHVKILTIHQAKGLESPIIFLADCGKQRLSSQAYNTLVTWPSSAPKPKDLLLLPPQKNLDQYTSACLQTQQQREDLEEINLLYVALTRARQYLYLSGNGSNHSDTDTEKHDWYHCLQAYMKPCSIDLTFEKNEKAIHVAEVLTSTKETLATPGLPSESNPSKLTTFQSQRGGDATSRIRGIVIHRALALLSEEVSLNETKQMLMNEFPQLSKEQIVDWGEHAFKLTQHEHLHALFDNTRYQQTFNELPLSFVHQKQQFYGVVDRLCVGHQSVWLVDYKTHDRAAGRAKDLQAHYQEQMQAYFIGTSLLYPRHDIRTSILLTDTATLLDYDL